jgi:hypothetical protein
VAACEAVHAGSSRRQRVPPKFVVRSTRLPVANANGQRHLAPKTAADLAESLALEDLTAREMDVLGLLSFLTKSLKQALFGRAAHRAAAPLANSRRHRHSVTQSLGRTSHRFIFMSSDAARSSQQDDHRPAVRTFRADVGDEHTRGVDDLHVVRSAMAIDEARHQRSSMRMLCLAAQSARASSSSRCRDGYPRSADFLDGSPMRPFHRPPQRNTGRSSGPGVAHGLAQRLGARFGSQTPRQVAP